MSDDGSDEGAPAQWFESVEPDVPPEVPAPSALHSAFRVYDVHQAGDDVVYLGDPRLPGEEVVRELYPQFREAGYTVTLERRTGEIALVASPQGASDGVPWLNVLLFLLTVGSTFLAGAMWYHVFTKYDLAANPLGLLDALPFVVAVLGVLGTHELGHYLASRYHGVDASLPYFIPMLPPFGTWGAVIRMRGHFPDRKALFDVGIAGPLAGLVAAVVVTAVGLWLPPVAVPETVRQAEDVVRISFGYPPLFHAIAWAVGEPLSYAGGRMVNPVVMGGWIGMLVTALNLLPVGQLDGGHVMRALLGPRAERVAKVVPALPFLVAGYVFYVRNVPDSLGIWVLWGVIAGVMAHFGPVDPISEGALDRRRVALGVATFALGVLCFTPVPVVVSA
jgi:membrane-associated protease RseP (regulator of RpoE activity)